MSKRTFRPKTVESYDPDLSARNLTKRPVAVYYRQSTAAQVGNISTSIQTIDMVDELQRRGWRRDQIILIDDDEGVSGMKRIDEREGMSHLFELIAEGSIGAVACQDEDRLFRDLTQIQVNIFIETCRKAQVKVITPFMTYDFAHPLEGEFHARQFRFKCEMAAEYIKSYVLGRLTPAKQRLLKEGKWAGARMPVGYMVDDRKRLPDGSDNPNWRKFIPFEPYAEIVRAYFRIFLESGGAIRKAMRQIREQGLSFPNCKPPEGFKISYQLKHRGDGYYLNRGSFVSLITNPVYVGHWCFRGVVVRWDNHTPIVAMETFARAFNVLSRYTLTGEENPDFQPAYQFIRPETDVERPVQRPLLAGLLYTNLGGKWYRTGCSFDKRNSCYLYAQRRVELEGTRLEWERRATWIDDAVVARFKQELAETFNSDLWVQSVRDTEHHLERERKLKQLELETLTEEKQNLVAHLGRLVDPNFIQEVERRYTLVENERERLIADLARLEQQRHHRLSVEQARSLFQHAIQDWEGLSQDERRNLLGLFIERIEVSEYKRSGDMLLKVIWRGESSTEIRIWHKSHGTLWSVENVEKLLALFDSNASQLEIAAAFPHVKWYQIFNELKKHRGLVRFTPRWLGNKETYDQYIATGGRKGKATGSYWRTEELAKLREMVERQASQLEIMQEFPYRRWIQLKARITMLLGKGRRVPLSGISQRLTYVEYEQQTKSTNSDLNPRTVSRCS